MKVEKQKIFSLAVVVFRTMCLGGLLVDALDMSQSDSNLFVVLQNGQIPTSGTTALQAVTTNAAVNCGNLCLQFNEQECTGFLFQKTTCDSDKSGILSKAGFCQLVSFDSLAVVLLGQSVNACTKFYVKKSSSVVGVTTTTTKPALLTSTTPLATTTVVRTSLTLPLTSTTSEPIATTTTSTVTTDVTTTKTQSTPVTTTAWPTSVATTSKAPSLLTTSKPLVTTTGPSLNPRWIYTIPDSSESVRGVTSYKGYVYVTREPKSSNQIAVYNATSFQLLSYITVTDATGNLYGMIVSPNNDYLFVSDYSNGVVFRVNMLTATSIYWSVADNPTGLTINGQNNLLVASGSGVIQEYTQAGSLVNEIYDGNQLNGVTELSDGTLAITRFGPTHGVALISNDGTVLYSYGSTTAGSGTGQMNWPGMLAMNSQGYFLVADSKNCRVVVLNPTLSQARTVPLPITGLNRTISIWLDESRDLLYVGEYYSPNRLLVFTDVYNLDAAFTT